MVLKVNQSSDILLINWINTSRQSSVNPLITLINARCSISLSSLWSPLPVYLYLWNNKLIRITPCHQLIIMQIKLHQSRAGLLICARSQLKFPKVLRDVHLAIRATRESGWCKRGEESRALTDSSRCLLFTVILIPSSLPSAFDVAARLVLCVSPALCPRLRKEQPKVTDKNKTINGTMDSEEKMELCYLKHSIICC